MEHAGKKIIYERERERDVSIPQLPELLRGRRYHRGRNMKLSEGEGVTALVNIIRKYERAVFSRALYNIA